MPELDGHRQAIQAVQQLGQIAAVFRGSGKIGGQLDEDSCKPRTQRLDARPVEAELLPPVLLPLVGKRPGQFCRKPEVFRGLGGHTRHRLGPRHLVPGVIQLDDRKRAGIEGQHVGGFCPGRVKAAVHPFRVRIAACP